MLQLSLGLTLAVLVFGGISLVSRSVKNRRLQILSALATLYPLGKLLQAASHNYPQLARSYVSDIGFIAAITMMAFAWNVMTGKKSVTTYRTFSWIALVAALAFEALQLSIGTGDWIDVAVFVGSWAVVQRILTLPSK
jgi:hypothetical protein